MKGKRKFSPSEAAKIRRLIQEKNGAPSHIQKIKREQIRRIGFYFTDYATRQTKYTAEFFDSLIANGSIIIA